MAISSLPKDKNDQLFFILVSASQIKTMRAAGSRILHNVLVFLDLNF